VSRGPNCGNINNPSLELQIYIPPLHSNGIHPHFLTTCPTVMNSETSIVRIGSPESIPSMASGDYVCQNSPEIVKAYPNTVDFRDSFQILLRLEPIRGAIWWERRGSLREAFPSAVRWPESSTSVFRSGQRRSHPMGRWQVVPVWSRKGVGEAALEED